MSNIFNDGKFSSAVLNVFFWFGFILTMIYAINAIVSILRRYSFQIKEFFNKIRHFFQYLSAKLRRKIPQGDVEKTIKYSDLTDEEKKDLNSFYYQTIILTHEDLASINLQEQKWKNSNLNINDFNILSLEEHVKRKDNVCSVCLNTFNSDVSVNTFSNTRYETKKNTVVQLPCKHCFHNQCISNWLILKRREGLETYFDECNYWEIFGYLAEKNKVTCPLCRLDLNNCKLVCNNFGIPMKKVTVEPI